MPPRPRNSAFGEDARDNSLAAFAEGVVQIVIQKQAPGVSAGSDGSRIASLRGGLLKECENWKTAWRAGRHTPVATCNLDRFRGIPSAAWATTRIRRAAALVRLTGITPNYLVQPSSSACTARGTSYNPKSIDFVRAARERRPSRPRYTARPAHLQKWSAIEGRAGEIYVGRSACARGLRCRSEPSHSTGRLEIGSQFGAGSPLAQVNISAGAQAPTNIQLRMSRRQYEYEHPAGALALTELLAQDVTLPIGKVPTDNDDGIEDGGHGLARLFHRIHAGHRIARGLEQSLDPPLSPGIILDEKYGSQIGRVTRIGATHDWTMGDHYLFFIGPPHAAK